MLSKDELENLKREVADSIIAGQIEYGKDASNVAEVRAYARSMVMNHLKKAKELNGNQVYGVGPALPRASKGPKLPSDLNVDLLSADLKEYVKTLV